MGSGTGILSGEQEKTIKNVVKGLKGAVKAHTGQAKELEKVQGHKNQIYSSHPSFLLRARALLFFSMSEPYYQFIGKSGTAPLSKSKLDTNIEKVIFFY